MNPDVKTKWVAALRSGQYKQTRGRLREGASFCCLGVLCNLHAQEHPDTAAEQYDPHRYMGQARILPTPVQEWSGLTERIGSMTTINGVRLCHAEHNDRGRSFKQIAKAIEEQL